MPIIGTHAHGAFCWVELATSDSDGAKTFYTALFDWQYQDDDGGPGTYTTLLRRDQQVGALYQESGPTPPHWSLYINVANADEQAARARKLGASVLQEPFDVMDAGRMAIVQDPVGAVFCLWQARKNKGMGISGEPGAFCWGELTTADDAAALHFYRELLGWTSRDSSADAADGHAYTELELDGNPIGGVARLQGKQAGTPAHWTAYFQVSDCRESTARARNLGASILLDCQEIPAVGRFSMMADPQGAVFSIYQPSDS